MSSMVSIQLAVDILNDMLHSDPKAINELFNHRVPCNEVISNNPNIQVGRIKDEYLVGTLGILNGIFGCDDELVVMIIDENDEIQKFKVEKFCNLSVQ